MIIRKAVLLLISITCSTIAVAVTCIWKGTSIKPYHDDDDVTKYEVYLLDSSIISNTNITEKLKQGDTSYIKGNAKIAVTNADYSYDRKFAEWDLSWYGDFMTGTTYNFYTVIFNNTIDKATAFMITNTKDGTVTFFNVLNMPFGGQVSNDWIRIKRKGFRIIIR